MSQLDVFQSAGIGVPDSVDLFVGPQISPVLLKRRRNALRKKGMKEKQAKKQPGLMPFFNPEQYEDLLLEDAKKDIGTYYFWTEEQIQDTVQDLTLLLVTEAWHSISFRFGSLADLVENLEWVLDAADNDDFSFNACCRRLGVSPWWLRTEMARRALRYSYQRGDQAIKRNGILKAFANELRIYSFSDCEEVVLTPTESAVCFL